MHLSGFISQFVRILCAVALLSVGFGHRVPDVRAVEFVATAYALPDGSLPDLCLTLGDKDASGQFHYRDGSCDACLISGAITLPQPAAEVGPRPMPQGFVLRPDRARFDAPPVLISEAAPRAPPRA
ncbi:hypothetical protein [Allorhizobium borbori]|uniref:DUF2946 domain-containing protein n=1 Tax=Allorhizobium borbori TaxID=485907 RepID=A0A7W6K5J4_9HYPH|nr:hypothetical protein [Allorhizobium borbori]MBB4105598.1 hypothetical protein [Allorhizobium borbori]